MAYKRKTEKKDLFCLNCGEKLPYTPWSYKIKYSYCKKPKCQAIRSEEHRKRSLAAIKACYKKYDYNTKRKKPKKPIKKDLPICRWQGCKNNVHVNGLVQYKHCVHHLGVINKRANKIDEGYIYHTPDIAGEDFVNFLESITGAPISEIRYGI